MDEKHKLELKEFVRLNDFEGVQKIIGLEGKKKVAEVSWSKEVNFFNSFKFSELNVFQGKESTALQLAAVHGHDKVVELLLAAGTEVNTVDEVSDYYSFNHNVQDEVLLQDGRTALQLAAWDGHDKVVELLLAAGVEVNTVDKVCSINL